MSVLLKWSDMDAVQRAEVVSYYRQCGLSWRAVAKALDITAETARIAEDKATRLLRARDLAEEAEASADFTMLARALPQIVAILQATAQ